MTFVVFGFRIQLHHIIEKETLDFTFKLLV
jgi:hypothetical protein